MIPEGICILLAYKASEMAMPLHRQLASVISQDCVVAVQSPDTLVKEMQKRTFDALLIDFTTKGHGLESCIERARYQDADVPILILVSELESHNETSNNIEYIIVAPGWTVELRKWLEKIQIYSLCEPVREFSSRNLLDEQQQLQKRARLWASLSKVSQVISSTLEPDKVLNLILEQTVQVLDAVGGSLVLVDRDTRELVFELALGPTAGDLVGTRMPWGKGLVGEAATTGQPLIVNDTAADPRWFSGYDEATDFVTQSILCAPMISRKEVIGVLEIVNKNDQSPFDESEAELLQALASQAAAALTNARLYAATRRQAEEVSTLLETSQAVISTLDLDHRLEIIASHAQELVDAHGCFILLLDEEEKIIKPIIALGEYSGGLMMPIKWGEGFLGQVAKSGKGRIIKRVKTGDLSDKRSNQSQFLLAVPLKVKESSIGVMALTRQAVQGFTSHDLELISSLGNQAAVAIENARLYNSTRQRNKELIALYSIAMSLGQTLEIYSLLEVILNQVPDVLGQVGGAIYLVTEPDKQLKLAHHHQVPKPVLELMSGKKYGKSAVIKTAEANQVMEYTIPLPANLTDLEPARKLIEAGVNEMRFICTPLVSHRRIQGVLIIPAYTTKGLRLGERRLLETLGRQIGMAIDNAVLYAQLQERAETLQKAYDELAEVDRLKDELVQNISHELRTPITFIKGYISLLLEGDLGELSQKQIDSLQIVNDKTEQLISLVNGILTLQILTTEVLRKEQVSPIHLAERAIEDAKFSAENLGIKLVADYPKEMPLIMADPTRITQVFDNLIQNAIKFSPDGGSITIRMRMLKDAVRVDIQDTGIGIPADKIDRIFDRFFQVDGSMTRRYGGAGLGLAICKQIVEAHGGKISAQSKERGGSTFTFTLPLSKTVE